MTRKVESVINGEELDQAANRPVLDTTPFTTPVIIDAIEVLNSDGLILLRSCSGGVEGISIPGKRFGYLYPILQELVIPYFIGKDARDLEQLVDGIYLEKSNYKLSGLAFWCCVAWVEFSLLDLLGKLVGKSIGALMGGVVRREIPVYIASGRRETSPEEEVALLQQRIAVTGARAVKFKVGGRMRHNTDSIPGRTKSLIPLARKVLGDGIVIHADANGSYDVKNAIAIGRRLEEIGARFFEEPCPFDYPEETKAVADALTIPVAAGEQETSLRRFKWLIQHRAIRVVQPDLHYNGGYIRSTRVARMAEAAGLAATIHISSGLGYLYMLHFASFIRNIGEFQEFKGDLIQTGTLFQPELQIQKGILRVPEGPGLGIAATTDLLRHARRFTHADLDKLRE